MGYCDIWCNTCKHACHISRMNTDRFQNENKKIPKGLRKHYFHTSPAFSTALSTTCGKQKPWFFAYPFEFMTNIAQFTEIRHQHPVQSSPDRNRFVTGFPPCCGKLCWKVGEIPVKDPVDSVKFAEFRRFYSRGNVEREYFAECGKS